MVTHFVLFCTCVTTQHIKAFLQFYELARRVRWVFKIGILLVPERGGTLPPEVPELPRGIPVMIDNGVYRYGQPLSTQELFQVMKFLDKFDFLEYYVIAPDIVGEYAQTVYVTERFIRELHKLAGQTLFKEYITHVVPVLQGRNIQEYKLCFETLVHVLHRTPARSIYNLSRIVAIGGLKLKLPRERVAIVDEITQLVRSYRVGNRRLRVHVLGMDLYLFRRVHDKIQSCDTANWTYNATSGHGLSIITGNLTLAKVNMYVSDASRVDWVNILANELFKYMYLLNLIKSGTTPTEQEIEELGNEMVDELKKFAKEH